MDSNSSKETRPPVGSTSTSTSTSFTSRPPHLARLAQVWIDRPIYFITTCTQNRAPVLASDSIHALLRAEWQTAESRHGWQIGRYVILPDHVHFFCTASPEAKPLPDFMQRWKEWTAKRILAAVQRSAPLWQPKFFDHALRSRESYAEKWTYVSQNPVRAGLAATPESWPHAGHIHFDSPL